MIDCIVLLAFILPPREVREQSVIPFIWKGLTFFPQFVTAELVTNYVAEWGNLRLMIKGDHLIVRNSLHKFFKGENYSDFTYTEVCNAIDLLFLQLEIKEHEFSVKKLEFGLNVNMNIQVSELLPCLLFYKGKEFDNLRSKAHKYGVKCFLTEYCVKVYDKVKQVKDKDLISLDGNLMRFELQFNVKRKIPGVSSLKDLKEPENLELLFQECLKALKNIEIKEMSDLSLLKSRDRELLFAGKMKDFWVNEKKISPENYKKRKAKYKAISQYSKTGNLRGEIEKLLTDKFWNLMGS